MAAATGILGCNSMIRDPCTFLVPLQLGLCWLVSSFYDTLCTQRRLSFPMEGDSRNFFQCSLPKNCTLELSSTSLVRLAVFHSVCVGLPPSFHGCLPQTTDKISLGRANLSGLIRGTTLLFSIGIGQPSFSFLSL